MEVDSIRDAAMGDCVVFKKLGKETERQRERGKGGGTLYWVCMKIMMRTGTIMRTRGPRMISCLMISWRYAMMLVISILWWQSVISPIQFMGLGFVRRGNVTVLGL
jgi:hypothetical protein